MFAFASDGLMMTHSCVGAQHAFYVHKLYDRTNPFLLAYIAPSGSRTRLGIVSSATRTADQQRRVHVHWGGYWTDTQEVVSTVNLLQMNTPTATLDSSQFSATTSVMASGRKIRNGAAATCGASGYVNDLSVFAFGKDVTSGAPAPRAAMDWFWIGNKGLYTQSMSSITGGSIQTPRTSTAGVSAGTLCIFAGGVTVLPDGTDGAYSTEVSVLDVSLGTGGSMQWYKSTPLRVARSFITGVYVPVAPGGSKVVYAGGLLPSGSYSNTVEIWDVATDTMVCTCMPLGARVRMAGTVVGDQFVILAGGYTSPTSVTSRIEVYDLASSKWLNLANGLVLARASINIGLLNHPAYPASHAGGFIVTMSGGDPYGYPAMVIEQLTTLWQRDSNPNGLPQPRYFASASSWPSAPISGGMNGYGLLAGGIGTYGVVFNDFLTLAAGQDATISSNWVSTVFPTPSTYQARQDIAVSVFPKGGAHDAIFWGGRDNTDSPATRIDVYTLNNPWGYAQPWLPRNHEGWATCHTGTFNNPNYVVATRGFGYLSAANGQGTKTAVNTAVWTERSTSGTMFDTTAWPADATAPARWDVTGLSAGRFCIFAGGYEESSNTMYSTINLFDAAKNNNVQPPTASPTGFPVASPSGLVLSLARRYMAAGFLPRPNSGGMTGYNGYVLFAGGQLLGGYVTDRIDIVDTSLPLSTWSVDSSKRLSVARRGASAASVGTRYIFIAGGVDASNSVSAVVDLFDAVTYSVTTFTPLSVPRQSMSAVVRPYDTTVGTYAVAFVGGCDINGNSLAVVDALPIVVGAGVVW